MPPRAVLVLFLLLPFWVGAAPLEVRLPVLETVTVREHSSPKHGRGLELTFKSLPPEPVLARLTVEGARAFVAAMEEALQEPRPSPGSPSMERFPRVTTTGIFLGSPANARSAELERRLRAVYEEIYGPSSMPLLSSLEESRWFQALKLSPRYMDEGVREAALEMLSSPTVAYSVALSMMLYMMAWASLSPSSPRGSPGL